MFDPKGAFELSDEQLTMLRAYAHYEGRPPNPLVRRAGEPNDNLILSMGRLIVDKGAAFLFGKPVKSTVTAGTVEMAEDWLTECWRRNKRALTLQKLATNGGITGHAFIRILDQRPFPRVIVLDPSVVTVLTDPNDCETVWKYTITPPPAPDQEGGDPVKRRTVIANPSGIAGYEVLADPTEWHICDQVYQGGSWQTVLDVRWPYPFAPIVDCQNLPAPNSFWGTPDLTEDILHLLEGINRVASHYNKIIRLHAHPKVWTRGLGARNMDISIDGVIHMPAETSELKALEMQSDLSSTMALLEKLLAVLSYIVRIPMVAMGEPDSLGAISGVALQIRYQPFLEKTEAKRLTYGDLLVELERRLLCMGGFGENCINELTWPELLPSDPLQERQVLVIDDELGLVSRETLSSTLGYSFEDEQQKRDDEREADIAAGRIPDTGGQVPAPNPLQPQFPDQAKTSKSS